MMKRFRSLAVLTVCGIALAACGPTTGGGAATKGTIKIGIDFPVSGADASDGQPPQNGAKLAIKQAGKVCGASSHKNDCFKLEAVPLDDAVAGVHNEQKGAQNMQQFVADADVLAEVGPLNSGVAEAMIPIANRADIAMISPANTNECLTKALASCKDKAKTLRPKGGNNYYRTVTTDDIQGPAGADFAYTKLGKKKVFILNDQQVFGKGIAENFEKRFKALGGTVIENAGYDPQTLAFQSVLNRAKAGGAEVVYCGGTTATKCGIIRKQMRGILDVPFVAGDGIVGDQFIKDADPNGDNSYFTIAAVDATKLDSAKKFIDDYKKEYGSSDIGDYGATAYEATNIIIAAMSRAIDDASGKKPTRAQVNAQIAKTKDFSGILGITSFDANGDTTNRVITIKKWVQATKKNEFVDQVVVRQ
jgi:branched-chain amino acid transport system substrate-binding protein